MGISVKILTNDWQEVKSKWDYENYGELEADVDAATNDNVKFMKGVMDIKQTKPFEEPPDDSGFWSIGTVGAFALAVVILVLVIFFCIWLFINDLDFREECCPCCDEWESETEEELEDVEQKKISSNNSRAPKNYDNGRVGRQR